MEPLRRWTVWRALKISLRLNIAGFIGYKFSCYYGLQLVISCPASRQSPVMLALVLDQTFAVIFVHCRLISVMLTQLLVFFAGGGWG